MMYICAHAYAYAQVWPLLGLSSGAMATGEYASLQWEVSWFPEITQVPMRQYVQKHQIC